MAHPRPLHRRQRRGAREDPGRHAPPSLAHGHRHPAVPAPERSRVRPRPPGSARRPSGRPGRRRDRRVGRVVTAPQSVFLLRSATGVALVVATVLASTVGFLNAYMINVAVPAIGRDLDADVSAIQWVLTGYLVTVAALLLVAGALADHFGRRRILIVGLFIMLAAALGCAAAPNAAILIVARLVQGVGGALVVPSSLAMLNGALIPVDRARGIGIWAGLSTLGATVGPYAGGWLVDHASWRYIFLLNLPLVLAAYWALRYVPEVDRSRRRLSLDVPGALLAVVGLGPVI